MNVLSLFDGMSCCRMALEREGIKIENYFASEIDKYAIKVTQKHNPETIQIGDVNNYKQWDLPKIKILAAGSPCQDLSRIKSNNGKGLHGEKSKLFFKFVEAKSRFNPEYFFLENVVMNQESMDTITAILGVYPVIVSSKHFSAQDRPRVYWTNIPFDKELPENEDVLKDILEEEVEEKYYYSDLIENFNPNKRMVGTLYKFYENGKRKLTDTTSRVYNPNFKAPTLTAVSGGHQEKKVYINDRVRKLTPLEYERLQTVPDNYTNCVSDSQRYKMLGNGWTVDTIRHFFKGLK
jgi:DNA-cytosine methyltransferase